MAGRSTWARPHARMPASTGPELLNEDLWRSGVRHASQVRLDERAAPPLGRLRLRRRAVHSGPRADGAHGLSGRVRGVRDTVVVQPPWPSIASALEVVACTVGHVPRVRLISIAAIVVRRPRAVLPLLLRHLAQDVALADLDGAAVQNGRPPVEGAVRAKPHRVCGGVVARPLGAAHARGGAAANDLRWRGVARAGREERG
mmetsp:Transcript_29086/g.90666  ORF Transcript_29086/g.90666 Transcript_29086/m.90666 type:complete len:201 (-) Transcript_29086:44-646(-)